MKKLIILILVSNFLTLSSVATAQEKRLTLDECMKYAIEHSSKVNTARLSLDSHKANYNESVASLFPSISGSIGGTTNFGRSIDPATNAYTNVTTFSNSYGVSASMTLFDGLRSINTIRAAKVARQMGIAETELESDLVAIETMSAYMDVVYYNEAVIIARKQLETSRNILLFTERQMELGIKSAADVADMESQVANYDYLLTTEENNLALAYIKLREAMNYPQKEELRIQTDITTFDNPETALTEDILRSALLSNPRITIAKQTTEIKRLDYVKAKWAFTPSLNLYGGYNTNYFIDFDNKKAYASFGNQFRNNRGGYIQASVSIPIFSGLNRISSKRRARNAWKSAQFEQSAVERAVESEVCEAWQKMRGAKKLYLQSEKKVDAAQIAYNGASKKYEHGKISAIELQTTANTLLQAKSEKLHAHLQYIIKRRMVDYYNGIPLIREQSTEYREQRK
ncbi:MAG: TolC family protein [Bacteroidaceae bacterium]|nr:TolC family protein [Bacteroidaceae bacterium]